MNMFLRKLLSVILCAVLLLTSSFSAFAGSIDDDVIPAINEGGEITDDGETGDSGNGGVLPETGDNGETGDSGDGGVLPETGDDGKTEDTGDGEVIPETGDDGETEDTGDGEVIPETGDNGEGEDGGNGEVIPDGGDNDGETEDSGNGEVIPDGGDNGEGEDTGDGEVIPDGSDDDGEGDTTPVISRTPAPEIEWPTVSETSVVYGTKIGELTLSKSSDSNGTFEWAAPDNIIYENVLYDLLYTPNDTESYDYTDAQLSKEYSVQEVTAKDIADTTVTVDYIANQEYTGSAITSSVVITDSETGETLVYNVDYTLEYANNIAGSTAKVIISGKGYYTGSRETTFSITGLPYEVKGGVLYIYAETEIDDTIIDPDSYSSIVVCENGEITDCDTDKHVDVLEGGTISGGTFSGMVDNLGTISGGEFTKDVFNNMRADVNGVSRGTISGGTFSKVPTNSGFITGGMFIGDVGNVYSISGGTFNKTVSNAGEGIIEGGTFEGTVDNYRAITGGAFSYTVTNNSIATISGGSFSDKVFNYGTISDGTFTESVDNYNSAKISGGSFSSGLANSGTISGGSFTGSVANNYNATISGGTFSNTVTNNSLATISGGSFSGEVKNYGTISDGTFTGYVENVDTATISGGTFSGSVDNCNTAIISGGAFSGEVGNNDTATISGGTFLGSVGNNQTAKITDGSFSDEVFSCGTISGGTFSSVVYNNKYSDADDEYCGIISGGSFTGSVENSFGATISGGTFTDEVENYGTISGGTFSGKVFSCGTISGGTFSRNVYNNKYIDMGVEYCGTISGGTFTDDVFNFGTISGGSFSGAVGNNNAAKISDGTFSGGLANFGKISGGTFSGTVDNISTATISGGSFTNTVNNVNTATISGGTFSGAVYNNDTATISGGSFSGYVGNYDTATISGGTFSGYVDNKSTIEYADGNSEELKLFCEIENYDTGIIRQPCSFGPSATVVKNDGLIEVAAIVGGENKVFEYGESVLDALSDIDSTKNWYEQLGETLERVEDDYVFDLLTRTFIGKTPAPAIEWPTVSETSVVYTTTVGELTLSAESDDNGTFAWYDPEFIIEAGEGFVLQYTPTDTESYDYSDTELEKAYSIAAVTAKDIEDETVTVADIPNQEFTGSAVTPSVVITDEKTGETLVEGVDYTVEYANNIASSTAKVIIRGRGRYTGSRETTFAITGLPYEINGGILKIHTVMAIDDTKIDPDSYSSIEVCENGEITDCNTDMYVDVSEGGKISGGTFSNTVDNLGTISGGAFTKDVFNNMRTDADVVFRGTISGGTFNKIPSNSGFITGGTFNGAVASNVYSISGGTFNGTVNNAGNGIIEGGTFNGTVDNYKTISGGTFLYTVTNNYNATISGGSFSDMVKNSGTISDGTFSGTVYNYDTAAISGGSFSGGLANNGTIFGGTFTGDVANNYNATISGGTFSGSVVNYVTAIISGGTFTGSLTNNALVQGYVDDDGNVIAPKLFGEIANCYYNSAIKQPCTFGPNTTVVKNDGLIEVAAVVNGENKVFEYGASVLDALNGVDSTKVWYEQLGDTLDRVEDDYVFDLLTRTFTGKTRAPEIEWPTVSETSVVYSTAVGELTLSAESDDNGRFEWYDPEFIIKAGEGFVLKYLPTDTVSYDYSDTELEKAYSISTVEPKDIADETVTVADIVGQEYTGSAITPSVVITDEKTGETLVENVDYTVEYANNIVSSTAKVIISGRGDYTGSRETTFAITNLKYEINGGVLYIYAKTAIDDTIIDPDSYSSIVVCENGEITDCNTDKYVKVLEGGKISGGTFSGGLANYGTISGGSFTGSVDNNYNATISDGTFSGGLANYGTISGGSFSGTVNNNKYSDMDGEHCGIVSGGTFSNKVKNNGTISGGTFSSSVDNNDTATISGGSFSSFVHNNSATISDGTFTGSIDNNGAATISGGSFSYYVTNYGTSTISGGTFSYNVDNNNTATISGGSFSGYVTNYDTATISGGSFSGNVYNYGTVECAGDDPEELKLYCNIKNYDNGIVKQPCTFGPNTTVLENKSIIEVAAIVNGENKVFEYGASILDALNGVDSTKIWYEQLGDTLEKVEEDAVFDLLTRTFTGRTRAPEIEWPTLEATEVEYGTQVRELTLSAYSDDNGVFEWYDPEFAPRSGDGFILKYKPDDTDTYDYSEVELEKAYTLTEVTPRALNKDNVKTAKLADAVYNGKAQTPKLTLTDIKLKEKLVKDKDYTLKYSSNVEIGTAKITITGIGSYSGTMTASFKIVSVEEALLKALDLTGIVVDENGEDAKFTAAVIEVLDEDGSTAERYLAIVAEPNEELYEEDIVLTARLLTISEKLIELLNKNDFTKVSFTLNGLTLVWDVEKLPEDGAIITIAPADPTEQEGAISDTYAIKVEGYVLDEELGEKVLCDITADTETLRVVFLADEPFDTDDETVIACLTVPEDAELEPAVSECEFVENETNEEAPKGYASDALCAGTVTLILTSPIGE